MVFAHPIFGFMTRFDTTPLLGDKIRQEFEYVLHLVVKLLIRQLVLLHKFSIFQTKSVDFCLNLQVKMRL